jgi:hypothetical protein
LEPKSSGIGTPDKNSLFEFPNQESRMPIVMQEFGENACMNVGFRTLKNIIKALTFSHFLQLTASLVNRQALGLVVDQLL